MFSVGGEWGGSGEPLVQHCKSSLLPLCSPPEKACYVWQSEEEECSADTGVRAEGHWHRWKLSLYVYVCIWNRPVPIPSSPAPIMYVLAFWLMSVGPVLIRCLRGKNSGWGLKHERLLEVLLPVSDRSLLSLHCECYLFIPVSWLWAYPVLHSKEENMTDKPKPDTLLETRASFTKAAAQRSLLQGEQWHPLASTGALSIIEHHRLTVVNCH